MSALFQLNNTAMQTRFNLDNTHTSLNGITPEILGYQPAPIYRMAYDSLNNNAYMVFGTKLWRGRVTNNLDLLWHQKPLANSSDVVSDISGIRFFGSMDVCCKVAIAHAFGHDRKVTFYYPETDTIEIIVIDNSTNFFPTYSCCAFDDEENLYVEYTEGSGFLEKLFFVIRKDGSIKRLADPINGAGTSFVWFDNKLYRNNEASILSHYNPSTDTWTDVTGVSGLFVALDLHKLNDNELIALDSKIHSYHLDTDLVSFEYQTSVATAGKATFLYPLQTGVADDIKDIDLTGNELTLCICIKITRQDGIIMGFTTHDRELTSDTVIYKPIDSIQATAVRHELGTGIGNLDVDGLLKDTILSSDSITETELRAGAYDSAKIQMYVVDWLFPANTPQTIITGTTGEINIMQGHYKTEVRGLLQRMSQQIGSLTTATCRVKRLGDADCKVDMTPFRHVSDVNAVQGPRLIDFNDSEITGYYDYGVVTVTSGANDGLEREIKNSVQSAGISTISLQEAFPYQFEVGDTVILEAGCNRLIGTCSIKFDNINNFRGEPFIPGTDQIIKVGRLN